ncbi:M28 family peptidase [Mucilaginibacter glaciei]|uniref:M28 family peptidase n=1 Tax=Mucilaginibacter glaciei TaxID=2772109 RepID=A0A926NPT1_9SPHI|nr:M28 family peptidase [Mucilaginibacter glaciei]MBD1393676.1 M28 family peptidase [Mucilaginibacter glaciei]
MNKLPLWITALGFAMNACAQQNPTAVKYANLITADDARKHLSILASDEFEGRETGKAGAEKAANYIANEFKKLGLEAPKGSYFFNVPLSQNTLKITAFNVNGQNFTAWKDFFVQGSMVDKRLTAPNVVFVGYGTEEELARTDVAGKVVIMINEDKPVEGKKTNTSYRLSTTRKEIVAALRAKNPALILAANGELGGMLKRFNGNAPVGQLGIKKDDAASTPVPLFNITTEVADAFVKPSGKTFDQLKAAAATAKQTQVIQTIASIAYNTDKVDVKAVDVVGFMPGSDAKLKNEVLVISAHYDHIGLNTRPGATDKVNNGADDDGSGTTGVLEIARAFSQAKKDGHGPKRSVLFLGNVGEEKGLLGSEYYTDHPIYPLANTIADLNIDMIGRVGDEYKNSPDSANYVYPIGSNMLSSDLHKIGDDANNTYTKLKLDYKYDDLNDPNQFYYRSDHYNFARYGVPIIFYFNGVHPDYHQPGDEVSKINFPLLAKRAQLVFYTGWELANRANRPVVDKPIAKATR